MHPRIGADLAHALTAVDLSFWAGDTERVGRSESPVSLDWRDVRLYLSARLVHTIGRDMGRGTDAAYLSDGPRHCTRVYGLRRRRGRRGFSRNIGGRSTGGGRGGSRRGACPVGGCTIVETLGVLYADAERADIYSPQEPGPWPVVVVVHGGLQTKDDFTHLAREIASQGAVVFNVDVSDSPPFVRTIGHVSCAVRFCQSDGHRSWRRSLVGNRGRQLAGGHHRCGGGPGRGRVRSRRLRCR